MSEGIINLYDRTIAPENVAVGTTSLYSKGGKFYSKDENGNENSVSTKIATVAQVTSGSSNDVIISASGLVSSNYGKRIAVIPLNQSDPLTGIESNYVRISEIMDGWKLTDVVASSGSSTSGSPAFLVKACPKTAISGSQNMLTTNPVIGQNSFDSTSGTGSVNAVVNSTYSRVSSGDKVWVYSASASACGANVIFAEVSLTFQNMV